jgi:hypothetical protein
MAFHVSDDMELVPLSGKVLALHVSYDMDLVLVSGKVSGKVLLSGKVLAHSPLQLAH